MWLLDQVVDNGTASDAIGAGNKGDLAGRWTVAENVAHGDGDNEMSVRMRVVGGRTVEQSLKRTFKAFCSPELRATLHADNGSTRRAAGCQDLPISDLCCNQRGLSIGARWRKVRSGWCAKSHVDCGTALAMGSGAELW